MSAHLVHPTLSPEVQRVLAEHRERAQQLREQYGDPLEHFAAVVRDSFDQESLEEALRELTEGGSMWDEDELEEW
ncbi:MAG: hypothetical protein H0W06_01480 [Chloroflexia bacterium]|nr:hypothetical protein [Chloroflexia bacterium]